MRTFAEYLLYLVNVFFSGVGKMSERNRRVKGWAVGLAMVMMFSTILGMVPAASAYSPTWDVLTPMEMEHAQAVTVVDSANDTAYIISGGLGVGAGNYLSVTDLVSAYNLSTGYSWKVAPILTGVRGASGGIGEDGRIYIFSGFNDTIGIPVATTQIYDIASDSWSTGANIPVSTWEAKCAAVWPNMYVIGGGSAPTSVQIYNATTNSWSAGTALPSGRYAGAAAYVESVDSIFYIGGNGFPPESSVLQYNIGSASWAPVASLPSAVTALDAATGADGLIYVVGGSNSSGNVTPMAYSAGYYYCSNNDTWYPLPSMNHARKYLGLVSYDDKILAFGGNDGGSTFNYVESLTIVEGAPSFSLSAIGQGGEAWLNMSLDAFAATKGTAVVYYINSALGTVYPAETQIFAAGNASALIEIPQSMPVGSYELHAYFGTTFETGDYTFPEAIFSFTVFATTPIQQQISDLQDQITQLEQLINDINSSLSAQLNDTMANITQLQIQLAQMNANLTLFVNQIQAQIDQVNTSLVTEIAQLQLALDQAKADLATAVGLVNASLSAQLNDTMDELATLQTQNDLLQDQIADLVAAQNDLEQQMQQMEANDQILLDRLDQAGGEIGGMNDSLSASIGSISSNVLIGLLGILVALLVAILVVFMSLSRKIKDIGFQQTAKGAAEDADLGTTQAGVESPDTARLKTRTMKQKSPEQQAPPPPEPPEEKL